MDARRYLGVTMVVFSAVAALQLVRLVLALPVTIGGAEVPQWVSAVAFVVARALATWAFKLTRRA